MSYEDVRKQLNAALLGEQEQADSRKTTAKQSEGYNTARQQLVDLFGVDPADNGSERFWPERYAPTEEKEPTFLSWLKNLAEAGNKVDTYAGYMTDDVTNANAKQPTTERTPAVGRLADSWQIAIDTNPRTSVSTGSQFMGGGQPIPITPATQAMSPEQQRAMQFAETKRREGEAAGAKADIEAARPYNAAQEHTGIVDWEGRADLINELNQIDIDSGYATDELTANALEARRREIIADLEAGDAAAGNPLQVYSDADRSRAIIASSIEQFTSGYMNAVGTALDILKESSIALGGSVDPYAGYATDEISAAQINPKAATASDFADTQQWVDTIQTTADNLGESARRDLEKAKYGLGALGQAGVDIAVNILQMGYDAALGGLPSMFVRSSGSSAQEARLQGADVFQQAAYGAVSGGIEVFTEKMFDGVAKIYGAGAADEAIEELIRKLTSSDFGRTALRWASGAFGEGIEEVASSMLAPFAERIYNEDVLADGYWNALNPSEILYDFVIGAAIGGLGGGMSVATGQDAAANYKLRLADAGLGDVNSLANDAWDVMTGVTSAEEQQAREADARRRLGLVDTAEDGRGNKQPETKREAVERQFASEAQETGTETPAGENGNVAEDGRGNEQPATKREAVDRKLGEVEQEEQTATDEAAQADEIDTERSRQSAYDMGQSGVSANTLTEETAPGLSEDERRSAFEQGREDARATAATRAAAISDAQKGGNLSRVKGTVRGENVNMTDLRRTFNDSQNTAYRVLTKYAETTGVNVVLYSSQADENGNYPEAQGRFQWKDDTIYIDINSGLFSSKDVNDLGKYTMLRTFSHEFTHFVEKWNAERYNEFREFVFASMEAKGENVNDLIESMQARDSSGKMTYEEASREVVADAMTDVLEDSQLVQRLANENPTLFQRLLRKLRQFAARVKQAYRNMTSGSTREAQALKENGKYLDGIVKMWDDIAAEAVRNYQGAKGETVTEKAAEKDTSKKEKPSKSKASKATRAQAETTEASKPAAQKQVEASAVEEDDFSDINPAEVKAELERRGIVGGQVVDPEKNAQSPFIQQVMQDTGTGAAMRQQAETAQETQAAPEAAAENTQREEQTNGEPEVQTDTVQGSDGNRSDGRGTVSVPAELQTGDVSGAAEQRGAAAVPAENGDGAGRYGDRPDAERDGRSGSEGDRESGVQRGRDDVERARQQEETHREVEHDVAEKSTVKPGGDNFVIGDSLDLPKGEKARYKANVDAIRLAKQLESEGRVATPEEQAVLSKYVGWGGLSEAFDKNKSEWANEFKELQEVLTEDEYRAARGSTENAHYTSIPVIKAMYRGLQKLGFRGGRMLEPSSGVGNFVGAMPADMSSSVKSWTMVELDNITGLIAKHLYPQADVRIEGFEKAIIPDNFMDVAIGNVPFSNIGVIDRAYPKKLTSSLHNYFFAKSLDKVRPGGVVMFITSSYTMNSQDTTVRRYLSKQADLLGAIRLPNNAFSGNAGTDVVTDILVLKKRAPGTAYGGVPFVEASYNWQLGGTYQNEYFTAHPEMVLGEQVTTRGMYRANEYTVNPFTDRGSLESQIDQAFSGITGQMDYQAQPTPEKTNYAVERAEKKGKSGGFVNKDGKLYRQENGALSEVQTDEKTAKRINGMLQIRDLSRDLLNAQMQGQTEKSIADARRKLNKAYDAFVKENGYLNSPANKKAFADDPDRFSLFALENWDSEKKTATKADIFKVDTVKPNRTITHVDSVQDGLIVSRNTTGGIDTALISRLTGQTEEAVRKELVDSEQAFKDRDGNLVPSEEYLSGNVRAKLREAQGLVGLDKDYQHNVDALKQIVPKDIPHEAIFVQPGTPWIPDSVYSDFAAYMLGGSNSHSYGKPDVQIHRSNQTGNFTIDLNNARLKYNYLNTQKWGTPARSFLNLLEAALNSRSVTVTRKGADGKNYVDKVATAAANERIEAITKEFQRWLWEDEERTKDLEYLYNETFNALVTPKYDGSNLTVNGLRAGWGLREHQANAVQRVISSGGNTLLAHRVGAGKTLEMAAAAMKLKELGIVKKPMFAVPKSLVAQWGKEFSTYFPTAKLLVAEQGDFTPSNRKTFANRIATGNYDAVIVSYEQFEKIPMSDDFTLKMYREQIDEIIDAIEEAKAESGQKSMSVKDMEKKRKSLQLKIDKLTDKAKDTDSIEFEQLGIDSIFVDEAHNFKNLFYTTSMNNVSGLGNKDGSKRAFDLYTKVRYLQQLNGGRGIVFATATPVMNSMSEMYIMQKYLQPDLLKQLGLSTFDAWAKQFGEVVNGVEIKPSGQGYRVKQSFSRFKNLSELQLLFRNFSDVLTKIPGLKIPKMKGGKVQVIESEAGEFQQEYMKQLEARADNIKNVDPSEDNMLKITSDGRKISYTQRMIDPSLPYEQGCKIYQCADKVLEEYKVSKANKGTQIIFLDMATPKGRSNTEKATVEEDATDEESAQLYEDLRARLVKLGIPAKEIAFIHDADTDAKKSKLFADVNDGKVRVLIGSTGKMGVGMNAQKRIVAIHHLDAPWRPGDVEQRDGRAFRQGNINEEVSKYVYVTKGSFDARLWDILGRKSTFIDQIMNGENVGREVEDTGEVTLSAAEIKALASGNPLIEEQVRLEKEIKDLENLYLAHNASVAEARKKLQLAKQQRAEVSKRVENARTDLKNRGTGYADEDFTMQIGRQKITDKKKAGEALMAAATAKANRETYTPVGTFAGFDILAIETNEGIKGLLRGTQGYAFNFYPEQTTRMITRMQNLVSGLDTYIEQQQSRLAEIESEIKGQESLMRQPFEKQAEFDQKRARYNEVMEELNPKEEQAIAAEGDEDTVESSTRQQSLSNTEILEMAADQLNTDKLSDAEKNALSIFQKRLNALNEAQAQRAALGQQYKEQQFQKGGSRAEAEKIRNRMQVMDGRIQRLQNEVVSLENKDVLRNVLNQARSVVEGQERAKGASALKQYRERRNESQAVQKYRARVRAQVLEFSQLMTRPSNKDIKKHVPAEIQKTLVDFLDGINLSSKTALASSGLSTTKADQQYLKSMRRLHDAIKENVDARGLYSGYAELPPDFLDNFSAMIRKVEDMVESSRGEFVVNEMSAAQLKELSQTLRTLKKYIVNMNKLHNNAVFAHADEAGENTVRHLMPLAASKKSGEIYKFIRFGYMRPSYAFDHFGEGGKSIEREFRDGQATQAFLARRVIDFAEKTYSGKEVDAWGKDIKTVKLSGGEEISLPVTHIMSLYCLNKRAQAQTHIYGDGIRVANYKANGKVQLDEGHLVTQEDVDKLVQQLTPHQIEVADALQNFMSTECAKWGNHVSMARFDVEQFTDPNYFPINSDGRYLPATADESPDNAGLYALLNMGFTKELKENAKNRIILYNVFDVFANHTASMTQYRSFALPVLDALKWFNYQNGDTSVRDQLSKAFGAPEDTRAGSGSKGYAEEFVLNLIRAYNGTSANGDAYDTTALKMLHRFNGAAIAYNLRVFIQQPTAITRAAMILSPAKLEKGLGMSTVQLRKLAEEMEAHSGIAVWKRLGFYDTNISRGLTDKIKQNPTLLDKTMEVGTKGAEAADRFTWAAMWYAAKDSVKRSAYDTEEAYFKAVTDLFEEVIYKTQVVDSVLTKSEFLRSKGGIARQLGSFMSEPSATVSMLMDAAYKYSDDVQRGMSRSEAWKRNGGNIAKTAGVYAVGQVVLAAMQSVIDAWRDDDEYDENWLKNFFQKYVNAFKGNVIEELLPFGKIPVLSEIYETVKSWIDYAGLFEKWNLDLYGNDVSSGLSMYLKYVNKTAQIVIDKLMGNKTNYTNYGVAYNLMRAVSNLSGIPIATAWREVEDAWNNTVGFFAPRMKLVTYERAIDRKYNELVRPTGVSQKQYEKYLSDADTSGNGSITQDELGTELSRAVKAGEITNEQAEAIWKTKWNGANSKTFSNWKSGEKKTTAATSETSTSAAKPAKVSTYDDFKSATKLYDKESAYNGYKSNLAPMGVSLDDFTKFVNAANADGNSSIKQAELGEKLYDAVRRGDMTEEEANAWFRVFWNDPGSKTYTKWAARNKK